MSRPFAAARNKIIFCIDNVVPNAIQILCFKRTVFVLAKFFRYLYFLLPKTLSDVGVQLTDLCKTIWKSTGLIENSPELG